MPPTPGSDLTVSFHAVSNTGVYTPDEPTLTEHVMAVHFLFEAVDAHIEKLRRHDKAVADRVDLILHTLDYAIASEMLDWSRRTQTDPELVQTPCLGEMYAAEISNMVDTVFAEEDAL